MRAKTLGVLLLALGCGGTDKPGKSSATGGQSAGGTTSTAGSSSSGGNGSGGAGTNTSGNNAGGSGGSSNPIGVTLGNTPAEACIAYAWAVCSRREECRGYDTGHINCTTATIDCPDLSFSPSATRTVEVLKQCATTYPALPCEQVRAEKLPSCVTPGARMRGEDCSFASQCSSLSCARFDTCGTCGVRAAKGESCAQADVECEVGTTCNTETDLCEAPTVVITPPLGANEPCVPGSSACVAGYYCKNDGLGGGTCTAEVKANESCAETPCAYGNYCAPDSTCNPYPAAGEPCGLDKLGQLLCTNSRCEAAADLMSGTCKPYPKVGEPCITRGDNLADAYCTSNLYCDKLATPPVCRDIGKPGEGCDSHNSCAGLSQCACADPTLTDCPDKRCIALQVAGQPCTAPNTRCHPAFECLAGVCQPLTLRGDFTQACGM